MDYHYLVTIIAFLATLLIILLFRQVDRRDRQIHLVKSLMEQMKGELDEKARRLRLAVQEMEDDINVRETSVRSLLKQMEQSLGDIDRHAGDLQQLQTHLTQYNRVLKELAVLTQKAEKRLNLVEEQFDHIDTFTAKLDAAEERIEALQRGCVAVEDRLVILQDEVNEQVEQSRVSCEDTFVRGIQERLERFTETVDSERERLLKQFEAVTRSIEELEVRVAQRAGSELLAEPSETGPVEPDSIPELEPEPEPELELELVEESEYEPGLEVEPEQKPESEQRAGSTDLPVIDGEQTMPRERKAGPKFTALSFDLDTYEPDELDEGYGEDDQETDDENSDLGDDSYGDATDAEDEEESALELISETGDEQDGDDLGFDLDDDYYEDDEIYIDDDDEMASDDIDDPDDPLVSEKMRLIESYVSEGFSANEIAELAEIPIGEVELILELIDYANDRT